jgi:hypothetical protein
MPRADTPLDIVPDGYPISSAPQEERLPRTKKGKPRTNNSHL